MDPIIQRIAGSLDEKGWKQIAPDTVGGAEFDLVASRRFLFNKWTVLVRRVSEMDGEQGRRFAVDVKAVTSRSKALLAASRFIFCVVADCVDPTIKQIIQLENSGVKKWLRFRGGRARILMADRSDGQILGRIPALPYDAHRFVAQVHALLKNI